MNARDSNYNTLGEGASTIQSEGINAALAAGELIERYRGCARRVPDFLHGKPYVILRDGDTEKVVYVDEQVRAPRFRKGLVQLKDGTSFIAYVNRHGSEHSAVYATVNPCKFVAVLDEHPGEQTDEPSWREFRAEFTPELSLEWKTWTAHNGAAAAFTSTEEFAYFIENNAPDFVKPEAATMMELALNFKANQSVQYKAVQRLSDGNMQFEYVNSVEARAGSSRGGTLKIPEQFEIAIPLFAGPVEELQKIAARFRYRLTDGGVRLWYDLVRPQKVLEAGFKALFINIADGTKRDVLLGITD